MRLSSLLTLPIFALGVPLHAQLFPATDTGLVVMSCGGRPAWVNATELVVDASTSPKGATNAQPPSCTLNAKSGGSAPLWDVYSLVQNSSHSWSDPPTESNLTSGLKGGLLPANASAGNPDSDGTHLVFTAQSDASSNVTPGPGLGYAIVLCNTLAPSSMSKTCCFNGGSAVGACGIAITPLNTGGASIDPHIDSFDSKHVYWTERNPSNAKLACVTYNSGVAVTVPWVEHWAAVTWGAPGVAAPTITSDVQWCPETSYFTTTVRVS